MRVRSILPTLALLAATVRPAFAGADRGDLSVTLAGEQAPRAQAVSGPVISVTPLSLPLGIVTVGENASGTLLIGNSGDSDLHITSIDTTNPVFLGGPVPPPIPSGGSAMITVTFTPLAGTNEVGTITIMSDAVNSPAVEVSVSGQGNAPPALDPIGDKSADAFVPLQFTVTASDDEDQVDDVITFSVSPALPAGATFDAGTGAFFWVPTSGDAGSHSFAFCAHDGRASDCEDVTIVVNVSNRPPVADPDGPYSGTVGQPIVFDGSGSSDPDGNGLTYAWDFGDMQFGSGVSPNHTYAAAGTYGVTLTVTDDGTPALSHSASTGATVVALITADVIMKLTPAGVLRLSGGGSQPVGLEVGSLPVTEVNPASVRMSTTYPGAGSVEEVSASADKAPTIGDLDNDGLLEVIVSFTRASLIQLLGNVPNNTTVSLVVTAVSYSGVPIRGTTSVTVKTSGSGNVNSPPVVSAPALVNGAVGSQLTITVSVVDADGDPIESLTAAPLPPGAVFTPGPGNTSGILGWMPGYTQDGIYSINFIASNNLTGSAATTASIDGDVQPVVLPPDSTCFAAGRLNCIDIDVYDADGDAISELDAASLPPGASLTRYENLWGPPSTSSWRFCWTPRDPEDCATSPEIVFTAISNDVSSDPRVVEIQVGCPSCPTATPVVQVIGPTATVQTTPTSLTVTTSLPPEILTSIEWQIGQTTLPGQTITPSFSDSGIFDVIVRVTDLLNNITVTANTVVTVTKFEFPRLCPGGDQWQSLAVVGPAARQGHAMVSDSSGHILLFGGRRSAGFMSDTWAWDGASWIRVSRRSPGFASPSPPRRAYHAMAFDASRNRVVLFGGWNGTSLLGDTWEWDGFSWVPVASTGPSPRRGHVMAYDEVRRRVVLFGGNDGVLKGDTWEWNGSAWTLVSSSGPSPRQFAAAAYDPRAGTIVLYGGEDDATTLNRTADTWLWNGTQWTLAATTGSGPGPNAHHAMAYSYRCARPTLLGGAGALQGTWEWTGAEWTESEPYGAYARRDFAMAFDPRRRMILLFGGSNPTSPAILYGDTWELCCPCDEAAPLDPDGNVLFPSAAIDTSLPITDQEVEIDNGPVSSLYPQFDTSTDLWYRNRPCPPAAGGEEPPEASLDSLQAKLGIPGLTVQQLADSMSSWQQQILQMVANEPDPLPSAGPVTGGCPLPTKDHPLKSPCRVFGGRDIVFVHGFQKAPVLDKAFTVNDDPDYNWNIEWKFPGPGELDPFPANVRNPAFYHPDGYWKKNATDYWEEHIKHFLKGAGVKNRYLVVAWPSTQPLSVGVQAVLTQIGDAMRCGIGVVDPSGQNDSLNFGSPSFVIVSHSTGGLLTDVAMAAADQYPNLGAKDISDRCKAHVALHAAFSGSGIATLTVGAFSLFTPANAPAWACEAIRQLFPRETRNFCTPLPRFDAIPRSVLLDLVPAVTQARWSEYETCMPVPTITVTGASPSSTPVLKNIVSPGFDDGTLTVNSTLANPNPPLLGPLNLWPSGFLTYPLLGLSWNYDKGSDRPRAVGWYIDQVVDPILGRHPLLVTGSYLAAGAIDDLSPTGMLQSVMVRGGGVFNAENRYKHEPGCPVPTAPDPTSQLVKQHFSYILSPSDHFDSTPSKCVEPDPDDCDPIPVWPDYVPAFGQVNREETRVITSNQVYTPYVRPDGTPAQALLPWGAPPVHEIKKGREMTWPIKLGFFRWLYTWWPWYRYYYRPQGWASRHEMDYVYAWVLNDGKNAPRPYPCAGASSKVPVPDGGGSLAFSLRNVYPNPGRGKVQLEITVPGQGRITISVFDVQGRLVRTITQDASGAGRHTVLWDGRVSTGEPAAAGVYFLQARLDRQDATSQTVRGRVVLLK